MEREDGALPYADRRHFFAVAARAMRQIVIDDARSRKAAKRGAGAEPAALDAVAEPPAPAGELPVEDILALDTALSRLEESEPRLAETVEWHFFGGLTFAEIADAREVSERTVLRDWRAARALLHQELAGAAS
jgi:RNA polymerase sigma factor (TIGR02999 family)